MSLWTLIPMRGFDSGKSRLAGVLGRDERRRLNQAMLRRLLVAVAECAEADSRCVRRTLPSPALNRCIVVTPDAETQSWAKTFGSCTLQEQRGDGLNRALERARSLARAEGAAALLILPADLPLIDAPALRAFVATSARGTAAIALDKTGSGTNALLIPAAAPLRFAYGPQSFARHLGDLQRARIETRVWDDPILGFDLDTVEDLAAYESATEGNSFARQRHLSTAVLGRKSCGRA